ncbi:hypothetical protein AGDE_02446 [Angomonas deanei]|nr:hypothetical protein AGDE_02446 [Angomonas deanei]|eukprot:EPY41478.1 hypothetical protein AGDE_02446 [Angomonas deanei]
MEINPQKCEALWFTVSTHTDDDQSEQHLTVSGHSIPIVTLGASKPPKLLGVRLDSRMNFGPAVSSIVSQSATRLAQLKCIASRLAGPRPHEQRQFVMGYGVSQLMYGSDLIWATTFETAKVRLDKAYNSLVRNVCCLPPTTDADSALLEANMLPSYILMICYRAALFEKLYAQFDWSRRPPLLFTPTKNQTLKLISSCEWSQQLTEFLQSAGVIQRDQKHTLLKRDLIRTKPVVRPWDTRYAYRVSFGTQILPMPSGLPEEEVKRRKHEFSESILLALPEFSIIIATDGGCDLEEQISAAVAVRLSSLTDPQALQWSTQDCGPIACSYRAEACAMLLALSSIALPLIQDFCG